jgi:hypothetical protein
VLAQDPAVATGPRTDARLSAVGVMRSFATTRSPPPRLASFVPPAHGEWLAQSIPGAIVHKNDLGHMGNPDSDVVERYDWLTADS